MEICTINDITCTGSGWSIIKAGAMAGVVTSIGSVLLMVIGLRLADGGREANDEANEDDAVARQQAFWLLLPNLFGMWLSSLLISLISGELTYGRAAVMAVPAAAMFGISTWAHSSRSPRLSLLGVSFTVASPVWLRHAGSARRSCSWC